MNIHSDKDSSIRWMNSLTNASNITVAAINAGEAQIDPKKYIEEYANFFFNLEPAKTDLENKIKDCKNMGELDSLKELVVKSDSVSMFNLWNAQRISLGA